MKVFSCLEWDKFLRKFPNHHILQTSHWGEVKTYFGWNAFRISDGSCGCQVLFRKLPLGCTIGYIPKGPVGDHWDRILPELDGLCALQKAIYLQIEPDRLEDEVSEVNDWLTGFIDSNDSIQPRRTILIDIDKDDSEILLSMKQKTRYNINLAVKKEILISHSSDIKLFNDLMRKTGVRDGFGTHTLAYYEKVYSQFYSSGNCVLLLAKYYDHPLAAIMVFCQGERAWYLYGASSNEERNRMPTYLLQWEAIRWAKSKGCKSYDLWGIPDVSQQDLESQFEKRSDGLWGVYRFKRGFGGSVIRAASSKVKIYRPFLYNLIRVVRKYFPE